METIYNFFNHPFFIIIGGIFATLAIIGILLNLIFWILGITPLLWRLGYGRWFRKIAIVADDKYFNILRNDLVDSGIFRKNNISQISCQSLSKVKEHYLLLVHYQSFTEENIKEILANKVSKAGLIFYYPEFSPQDGMRIPDDMLKLINSKENTTIVNFRGRLLNDIITTFITTSYGKR
jgi:hypothetical protein